jgi:mono/diheme cytochrome c family protein
MRRLSSWTALVAALTTLSCAARTSEDLGAHMDEHFAAAVDVQTAVVRGDLAEAREQAVWLARHPTPASVAGSARAFVDDLRSAADDVATADDLEEAASATSRLALACGSCHTAAGTGPSFLPGSPPSGGSSVRERMTRHIWAADRMWEGLIAQSDESWQAGADILSEALLSPRFVTEEATAVDRMNALVDHVAGVATFARRERSWDRRAALYGELLPTCSGCHQIVGVDPLGVPGGEPLP